MSSRSSRTDQLTVDSELNVNSASFISPLSTPWQTLSALAAETGNAIKETLADATLDADGSVKQGSQQHVARELDRQHDLSQNEPQSLSENALDSATACADEAVQAHIRQVTRRIVSTDTATEVVLRFNFLSGKEAKVR